MYFVYSKQINVASKYSYNANDIVEWFKNYIDDFTEAYGIDTTAQDIVDNIFYEPDYWYDSFIRSLDIEQDVIDNMTSEDLSEQIKEVAAPYDCPDGDIDAEDITELVTGDEFLEKFKEWYLND